MFGLVWEECSTGIRFHPRIVRNSMIFFITCSIKVSIANAEMVNQNQLNQDNIIEKQSGKNTWMEAMVIQQIVFNRLLVLVISFPVK